MNDNETYVDVDQAYSFFSNPPDVAELTFPGGTGYFRSITVNNQSSRLCAVYTNQSAAGTPLCTVPPGTFLTQPLGSAEFLSVRFFAQKGGVDTGTIYVHACNTVLAASSGVSSAAGAGGIVFDYSTFDTGAAFSQ